MTGTLVRRETSGGVATITLDSPGNRNALSAQLRRELIDHLDAAAADEAARVIVLTHAGSVFCAGLDLKEPTTGDGAGRGTAEIASILEILWTSPIPVVARLTGPARAGGVGIVAACDIAIAAREATFAFTEVRLGVVPAMISATVLPRLLPRAAQELFLTGETIDAARAAEIGLLSRAVPADEVDAEVDRVVAMLRLGAPGALAGTKELLSAGQPAAMADHLAAMTLLSARYFTGQEGQEGIRAFAEKRQPRWAAPATPTTTKVLP